MSPLRCHCNLARRLIGTEAQKRCNVTGTIKAVIVLEIEQLDVATDGNGNDGVANVSDFASGISASYAQGDEVGIEVAAVNALDRSRRIVFAEEDCLQIGRASCRERV